jgi:hypothetical protein
MKRLAPIALLLFAGLVQAQPEAPLWGAAWDDLRFEITEGRLPTSNPPTIATYRDDGAGSDGVQAAQFLDNGAGSEDQYWFDIQMPHGWVLGTDIESHIHYAPEDGTTCNYRVCVEYACSDNSTDFPANTSTGCTTFASNENASRFSYQDVATISMSGLGLSAGCLVRLYRDSANAADTCNSKYLWIFTTDVHFRKDRPGSRQELSK